MRTQAILMLMNFICCITVLVLLAVEGFSLAVAGIIFVQFVCLFAQIIDLRR